MAFRIIHATLQQSIMNTNVAIRREIVAEVRDTIDEHDLYLKDVVAQWEHQPRFKKDLRVQPMLISGTLEVVGANAAIFRWVDEGTRPHLIPGFVSPDVTLKFQTAYSARTAPIAQYNVGTGRATGSWRSAKQVHHPGTEAREFIKTTVEELRPSFPDRLDRATQRSIAHT